MNFTNSKIFYSFWLHLGIPMYKQVNWRFFLYKTKQICLIAALKKTSSVYKSYIGRKHSYYMSYKSFMSQIYEVHTISFQTFFVWAFKIIVDSWKLSILLLFIFWDDWPNFIISASNEQLQQQLEYTLLKPDCHSWWISKMQSDTLEERYAMKFCFKLGKNATETYGMLHTAFRPSCMNRSSVLEWHKTFKEGRESVRDDERCGRSKGVNTPELIDLRVRVRVTMLRF